MLSHVQLSCHSMTCSLPGYSAEFPRQEHWGGWPFLPRGDLPDPGTEPASPASPALAGRFFTTEPPGKPPESFIVDIDHACPLLKGRHYLLRLFAVQHPYKDSLEQRQKPRHRET